MAKIRIIASRADENEFYDYLYKITMKHRDHNIIPKEYFQDLIKYFEKIEDYEKCKNLHDLIKDRTE